MKKAGTLLYFFERGIPLGTVRQLAAGPKLDPPAAHSCPCSGTRCVDWCCRGAPPAADRAPTRAASACAAPDEAVRRRRRDQFFSCAHARRQGEGGLVGAPYWRRADGALAPIKRVV